MNREPSLFRTFRVGMSIFMALCTIGAGALAINLYRLGENRLALGVLFMLAVCLVQAWRFWRGNGDMMQLGRERMQDMQDYIDSYHRGEVPPSPESRPESLSRIEALRDAIHNASGTDT